MKRNHASKCAEIDFSYKQDAKIVHFLGKFATSSESAWAKRELYTVQLTFFKSHMVKVAFEKQFIRKRVERNLSSPFSAFLSLLFDDGFLISFQI